MPLQLLEQLKELCCRLPFEVINLIRSTFFHSNESGGHAVKLEGGKEIKESIKKILNAR
jgi:ketopantoate hydroxymethyltransferase